MIDNFVWFLNHANEKIIIKWAKMKANLHSIECLLLRSAGNTDIQESFVFFNCYSNPYLLNIK